MAVPPVEGIRINNGPPPAGGPVANNPDNQTMVNILTWPPPRAPILMTDLDSYRTSAIDNIFCRGFTAAEAPLHPFGGYYHILDAIQNQHFGAVVNPDFQAANIQALLNCYHVAVTGAVFPILPPPPAALAADINNYIAFFAPLAAAVAGGAPLGFYPLPPAAAPAPFVPGTPDPARAAAEFVNLLVSDHMPVLFTMIL